MRAPPHLSCLLIVLCMLLPRYLVASDVDFTVAIMRSDAEEAENTIALIRRLQPELDGVRITLRVRDDEEYKRELETWLEQGSIDAFYWYSARPLCALVNKGLLAPVSLPRDTLERRYTPATLAMAECDERLYGVPVSFYQWGFFYHKPSFSALGLKEPDNWDELVAAAAALKAAGVTPFSLGSRYDWPVLAWFQYLNLRINGLQAQQNLLDCELSFSGPEVTRVLQHWKLLIERRYFTAKHRKLDIFQTLPYLYRGQHAMLLAGSFIGSKIPPRMRAEIGFFPVPGIAQPQRSEIAPTDVFALSHNASGSKAARQFLEFMSRTDVQEEYARHTGLLPPNRNSRIEGDSLKLEGAVLLRSADNLTDYLDRLVNPELAAQIQAVLVRFVDNPDIEATQRALVQAYEQYSSR